MEYHFRVHEEKKSFWAECVELEGCYTEADNLHDLEEFAKEALDLYLTEPAASKNVHPLNDLSLDQDQDLLRVEVSPELAFITLLRWYKFEHNLTQEQMKEALGMKHRNSYVNLERRGNPTLKTIGKILKAFPDFPAEKMFVSNRL